VKTIPKYLTVLKYLYDNKYDSIHYIKLTPIIFSQDIIDKYRSSRGRKCVIDGMVCKYMGKLCRKDYAAAHYECVNNYSYFVGYYICEKGIELLKEKKII
jgi:hypothetical protein